MSEPVLTEIEPVNGSYLFYLRQKVNIEKDGKTECVRKFIIKF